MGLSECIAEKARGLPGVRDRSCRILAKSIYRELRLHGFTHKEIVGIASDLVGLVTADLKPAQDASEASDRPVESLPARAAEAVDSQREAAAR